MFFNKNYLIGHLIYMSVFLGPLSCSKPVRSLNDDGNKFENTVLLISFDGFKWDYIDKAETPNFDEFISCLLYTSDAADD